MSETYNVIIIGAGPAGLAAAIYTSRARLKTLVVEKGMPGGQILLTDFVENYPGFPDGIVPFQLMDGFRKQAEQFGAEITTDEITQIKKKNDLWIAVGRQTERPSQAVIVCTGSVYRKLGIGGEEKLVGKGVSYCATCDGSFFKDKDIAVVGGGDHALREALFLTKFCRSIKLIHRRRQFRGEKIYQERVLSNQKIEILWETLVEEISGQDKFESITVKNLRTNRTSELKLDGLFVSIGTVPNSGLVRGLLDLDKQDQIKVHSSMATSQPGVFAAGDVTNACPQQIATAVGTGVTAALSVNEYLESP